MPFLRNRCWATTIALSLCYAFLVVTPLAAHESKLPAQPQAQTPDKLHSDMATPDEAVGAGHHHHHMAPDEMESMAGLHRLMMPQMDPARGRKLFASKGCVTCHSVNGVGGHDATALDAHTMERRMNPFEFAAKMWQMAPAMIYAQEEALGEQILFTGDELADIIAFVHDDEEQHHFSEGDIPPEIEKLMHHQHGEPGGGATEHAPDIGHMHGAEGHQPGGMHQGAE